MAYKSGLHKKVFSIFDGVQAGTDAPADAKTPATKQPFPPSQTIYPKTPLQQKQDLGHFPSQQVQKPAQELYKDSADKKAKVPPKSNGRAKVGFMQLYKKIQTKILPSKNGLVSNRQKASVVLIPVLCIVMFVVLFNVLGSPPPRKKSTAQTQVSSISEPKIPKLNWKIPAPLSPELRDPMQLGSKTTPYAGWSGTSGNLVLKGIVQSDEMTTAIIGDSVVHEGDMLGKIKVVKINKDNVELEKDGQKFSLRVGQNQSFRENVKSQ